MNEKLMSDVGENYEYVRTIINNKIELFKIDLAQNIAKTLGLIVFSFFLFGMFFILLAVILTALFLFLSNLTGSPLLGLLIIGILLILLILTIYFLRKTIIFKPTARLFYSKIADKI